MISEKLVDIKNEVDTQEDIINSIALALDGKSIPNSKYIASANCSTYGQVYEMLSNDGVLSTRGNYVLVNKQNFESMQIVNFTTNESIYVSVIGWRSTSCKGYAALNGSSDATLCIIAIGDEYMFIPY